MVLRDFILERFVMYCFFALRAAVIGGSAAEVSKLPSFKSREGVWLLKSLGISPIPVMISRSVQIFTI